MRLTDRHPERLAERGVWATFESYSDILGVVLDDKLKGSHLAIYEHVRYAFGDMYMHPRFMDDEPGDHLKKKNDTPDVNG